MAAAPPVSSTPSQKPARRRKPAEISPEALVARMQAHGGASPRAVTLARAALEDARDAGLLATETEHISLRVPKGLLAAAKRETGLTSNTDLGLVALSSLAVTDPFVKVMEELRGTLGPDHTLEY